MVMALIILARTLRRTYHFLPFLFPSTPQSVSLFPSKQKHFPSSFSSAFHQTLSSRCDFFTLHFSSTPTINNPFSFTPPTLHTNDPQQPLLLESLKRVAHFDSQAQAMAALDESGVKANANLVCSVIWALKEEWRLAYLVFKWGEKWGCADDKVCELMVWVLGSNKKFNIAWCLIRDMYKSSINTKRAMLVMIDRYASANNPCKAIRTFHFMEKFRILPDEEAYLFLLNALCGNGYVEEAEEFMLVNKKLFPLETDSFNIILNGWCNIDVDVFEAKRIWREMSKYCITPNATSYSHIISCFSKVGNLFDSLRLYDEMKKRDWIPGREVYNSLIYVLTHENCFDEALKMLEKMKAMTLQPDSATYNSMILPLCEAEKLEEARNMLAIMIKENLSPTTETYHAFLKGVDIDEILEILDKMSIAGLGPNGDTFLLILGKFFKLEQPENALKIWVEMKQYEVIPTSTHYTVLVEGLACCGLLLKAREFYAEMTSNGFSDDPKLKSLLKEPVEGNKGKREQQVRKGKRDKQVSLQKGNTVQSKRKGQKRSRKRKKVVQESDSKL
ncbi:pentatricopeptide repeat-containing protein At1g80880, mitochondrial [Pistacia vera]|uniref:pentatricopeptide repeat-containing protein At1g80880, mitochondrial n=1 Tax=Pistacia vera TaxID=55513 RepID=UPI0012634638|nr:pentatricopeptide repeat-containing protein At1g80880, mitochondrial [Pistacia vera]XP_031269901.1 pentatricopeptide repeat-containing protein At1g80880, mitochondrial [Pistacia vera]